MSTQTKEQEKITGALVVSNKPTFSLMPTGLKEAIEISGIMAKSDFVPTAYRGKPGNIIVAIQMGTELGLQPMQALQNIAVINGRPTLWGDAMLAIIKAHKSFEWIKEDEKEVIAQNKKAACTVKRRGQEAITRTFSMEDAERAGLIKRSGSNGCWATYPERMLQMRARSFALRDAWPDLLRGMQVREEVEDYDTTQESAPQEQLATKAAEIKEKLKKASPPPQPKHTEAPKPEQPAAEGELFAGKDTQPPPLVNFETIEDVCGAIVKIDNITHLSNWWKKHSSFLKSTFSAEDFAVIEESKNGRKRVLS
jgi:hypothetical protein